MSGRDLAFVLFALASQATALIPCCIRDGSGTIDFNEFKKVYQENVGPDSIPFNFDWYALLVGLDREWS